ncbi:MAG: DUF354 domain-containing protein [Magnetococcales bacterium]|nr:DUF354 domain-containing protein [Magnetococcales bacterium]
MKILVDIVHPAHVHFFRNPIALWQEAGHEVCITSRKKEIATDLLDHLALPHQVLSELGEGGLFGLAGELIRRNRALLRVINVFNPDVMVGIAGPSIAHTGVLKRIPSIVFYDTENATLSNAITYPFASWVVVPRCYASWLPRRHHRYSGYHELSYLHPARFTPDRALAEANGLDPERQTFFLRTVSWQASHDRFDSGWSIALLETTVEFLAQHGHVIISSEQALPDRLKHYAYTGDPFLIHHVMAFSRLFVGESATMASECAVLGVPAIYAANTGRGYTDEQETLYGLVANLRTFDWPMLERTITRMLERSSDDWQQARKRLLDDTEDVAKLVADTALRVGRGESPTSVESI